MRRESPIEGAELLEPGREQGEMAAFVLSNPDEVGEELGRHRMVVGSEASNDVPGKVDCPALGVDQTVEDGLSAVEGAAFTKLGHQVRRDKFYLFVNRPKIRFLMEIS